MNTYTVVYGTWQWILGEVSMYGKIIIVLVGTHLLWTPTRAASPFPFPFPSPQLLSTILGQCILSICCHI